MRQKKQLPTVTQKTRRGRREKILFFLCALSAASAFSLFQTQTDHRRSLRWWMFQLLFNATVCSRANNFALRSTPQR